MTTAIVRKEIEMTSFPTKSRELDPSLLPLIEKVKKCYEAYRLSPSRPLRSAYFASLAELAKTPRQIAFSSDSYIHEAENLEERFKGNLETLDRLREPAKKYRDSLSVFENELAKSEPRSKILMPALQVVIHAHSHFGNQFIPEFKKLPSKSY